MIIDAWEHARGALSASEFCRIVGISRTSLWRYGKAKPAKVCSKKRQNQSWHKRARQLAALHPTYGYRRLCVMLKRDGVSVGLHRLRVWMRAEGLSQQRVRPDDGRTPGSRPAEPSGPNAAWQMDATKIHTLSDGWVWQTSVLDVFDRRIVSCVVRKTCRAEDALDALALALDASFGCGRATSLSVIHDRGSQFTSHSFREMVRSCGAKDVTTAVRHPESCGRLERFHRTLKEELIWRQEWHDLAEVQAAVAEWVHFYNHERPHSALGYRTPAQVNKAAQLQNQAA